MDADIIDLDDDVPGDKYDAEADTELQRIEEELAQVEEQIEILLAKQQNLQDAKQRLHGRIELNKRAPKADWTGTFGWDTEVLQVLYNTFGLQAFRNPQREVINALLQGRDILCLMPSGGGKSLCYQLPALVGDQGITLVISPLLSLISDQVFHLHQSGIRAAALTSLSSKEAISETYKNMDSDSELRFVYATPERLVNAKRFLSKLERIYKAGRLKRIAIDEAHCCSQWGNDFRPDYKKLGLLKQLFPDAPIIALTATATQRVQSDLRAILRIPDCEVFQSSINRPNLYYEVKWKPNSLEAGVKDMVNWINTNFKVPSIPSGIVYCLTRKDTESVAEQLNSRGVTCLAYHADQDPMQRHQTHELWRTGQISVMVATIAFGMGINKPDVRFVIHHSLSKSIENYYQESGRAGRDGLPARCCMYYRPADLMRQAALVVSEPGWENHLYGMLAYAQNHSKCRRSIIARHFSEAPANCHNVCQVCAEGKNLRRQDIKKEATKILDVLQAVPGSDKRLTLVQLIDKWKTLKELSKEAKEQIIGSLVEQGILTIDFGFTAYATNAYLKASRRGLRGYEVVEVDAITSHAEEDDVDALKDRKKARKN